MSNENTPETAETRPAVGGPVQRMVRPSAEARWYCVSRDGLATLCASERNAHEMAAECARDYPRQAPYRAVLMGDVEHERNNADNLRQQTQDQAVQIDRLRRDRARTIDVLESWRVAFPDAWGLRDQQLLADLKRA